MKVFEAKHSHAITGFELTERALALIEEQTPYWNYLFRTQIQRLYLCTEPDSFYFNWHIKRGFWNPWKILQVSAITDADADAINASYIIMMLAGCYLLNEKRWKLRSEDRGDLTRKAALRFLQKLQDRDEVKSPRIKTFMKIVRVWNVSG